MRRGLAIAALVFPWAVASAQGIHYVQYFDTQALRYSAQGEVTACGARFLGVSENLSEAIDASVNVRKSERGYFGVIKFISSDVTLTDGAPKLSSARLRSAWIRAKEGSPVRFPNDPLRGDDGASILYSVSPDDAAALLLAVVKRESFFIAVKRESASAESVYSGPIKMTERDADEIAHCVRELMP